MTAKASATRKDPKKDYGIKPPRKVPVKKPLDKEKDVVSKAVFSKANVSIDQLHKFAKQNATVLKAKPKKKAKP